MRGDDHRIAAEQLEAGIAALQAQPDQERLIIEAAWLAGFHWIAYGCERRHGQHREKHQGLMAYLNQLGEGHTAVAWQNFERVRQGGVYGRQTSPGDAQQALKLLNGTRLWATT